MAESKSQDSQEFKAFNYWLCFIDLLGQRDAVRNEGLLPEFQSEGDKKTFYDVFKKSIYAIHKLHQTAEGMIKPRESFPISPIRSQLPQQSQEMFDQMMQNRITTQRWSDGLVLFFCLDDQQIKNPVSNLFKILAIAGAMCFLGLAERRPIRGGIDLAWGAELYPGEIYGPVVARAYELESEIAQYPRIVVSPGIADYLETYINNDEHDIFSESNCAFAVLCSKMLSVDLDGNIIVHYLGEEFQKAITQSQHATLYSDANSYVVEQLAKFRKSRNSKLAFRYTNLADYFKAHPHPTHHLER